jgi:hypothetical protein
MANTICGTVSEGSAKRRLRPLRMMMKKTAKPPTSTKVHQAVGTAGAMPAHTR